MGDIRFVMIGIALIFTGFITFGVFGEHYQSVTIQSDEFDTCYEYIKDAEPIRVSCEDKIGEQALFFAVVAGFIGAGVISLIKGAKGDWDNKVKPEDMVGPRKMNLEKEYHNKDIDTENDQDKDIAENSDYNIIKNEKDKEDAATKEEEDDGSKSKDNKDHESSSADHKA